MKAEWFIRAIACALICALPPAYAQSPSITAIAIGDKGSPPAESDSSELVVDVVRGTCVAGTESSPEPFFDSTVRFNIQNNANRNVRIESYRVVLKRGTRSRSIRSKWLAPAGLLEVAPNESAAISGLLFDKRDSRVRVPGSRIFLEELGFRTVQFEVRARGGTQRYNLTGSIGISFRNEDRCEE